MRADGRGRAPCCDEREERGDRKGAQAPMRPPATAPSELRHGPLLPVVSLASVFVPTAHGLPQGEGPPDQVDRFAAMTATRRRAGPGPGVSATGSGRWTLGVRAPRGVPSWP